VKRPLGYVSVILAVLLAIAAGLVGRLGIDGAIQGIAVSFLLSRVLSSVAVVLAGYGLYLVVVGALARSSVSKRRQHEIRNLLRLVLGVATLVSVLGVVTAQWVGLLFSLGIVGFAITFALQQPLFSLLGWVYIVSKRPYQVGDRVAIEDSKGDVVEVDFLVTTLWEINGDLVSSIAWYSG
jgi:small-conductance mechanosensitive channel